MLYFWVALRLVRAFEVSQILNIKIQYDYVAENGIGPNWVKKSFNFNEVAHTEGGMNDGSSMFTAAVSI